MTDFAKEAHYGVENIMQLYAAALRQGKVGSISAAIPVRGCWHCGALIKPGKVCETCTAMPLRDR